MNLPGFKSRASSSLAYAIARFVSDLKVGILCSRIKIVVFLILISYLFLFLFQSDKALTQDLGRHIKTGEIISNCFCVPKINLFSFTEPNHIFINHHWLSEVVFYNLFKFGGIDLIITFKIIMILLSFSIVVLLAFKRASPFWVFIFSVLFINIFSERFDARPEIFSFLFLSLFLLLIDRFKETGNYKFLFFLPLIEVFWVNLHIYFILGLIVFSFLIAENFFKKALDRKLILIFGITIFTTLINPNFILGAINPLTILQNYGYSIVENQNIFFLNSVISNPRILMFEIAALILVIGILFNLKKIGIFEILLSCFSIFMSFYQIRSFPIFILSTLPIISFAYFNLEEKNGKQVKNYVSSFKFLVLGFAVLFLFVSGKNIINSPFFGFSYIDNGKNAVDFMEKNNIKGPIFNNFDIGSYLVFRLYPTEKVFVDGRPEAYSVSFFDNYKAMQENQNLFDLEVKRYNINTIFFAYTDMTPWGREFLKDIVKNPDWNTVYLDNGIIILVRNNEQNKKIIEKFKIKPAL